MVLLALHQTKIDSTLEVYKLSTVFGLEINESTTGLNLVNQEPGIPNLCFFTMMYLGLHITR